MNDMTKKELRAYYRAARAGLTPAQRAAQSSAICAQILQSEAYASASCVLLYAAQEHEIDLSALAAAAWANGKTVAYPKCLDKMGSMAFYVVDSPERLVSGSYGIAEPSEDCLPWQPVKDALCVVPALAVDAYGNRLGYGKGYYDRFLGGFIGVSVCAAYTCCLADWLPSDTHDVPVAYVVTHDRWYYVAERERLQAGAGQTVIDDAAYASASDDPYAQDEYHVQDNYEIDDGYEPAFAPTQAEQSRRNERLLHGWKRVPVLGKLPLEPSLLLVCGTFVLLLLSRLLDAVLLDRDNEYLAVVLLQLLIFIIPGYLYLRFCGAGYEKRLRLRAPKPDHIFLLVSAAGALITGCFLLSVLMGNLSAGQSFVLYDTFTSRHDGTLAGVLYLVVAYAVLPAICEELIFRGILCAEFEGRGVVTAVAVSSLLFSMLHFNLPALPVYLFAGVVLALVLYTTRSVFCAIIVHFLYNLFCLFGQSGFADFYVTQSATTLFLILMIAALLLCLAVFFGESSRLYRAYAKQGESDAYRPTKSLAVSAVMRNVALAFASPGAIVCVLLYLIICIFR